MFACVDIFSQTKKIKRSAFVSHWPTGVGYIIRRMPYQSSFYSSVLTRVLFFVSLNNGLPQFFIIVLRPFAFRKRFNDFPGCRILGKMADFFPHLNFDTRHSWAVNAVLSGCFRLFWQPLTPYSLHWRLPSLEFNVPINFTDPFNATTADKSRNPLTSYNWTLSPRCTNLWV